MFTRLRSLVSLLFILQAIHSSHLIAKSTDFSPISTHHLNNLVKETSGLVCQDDGFLTINDSGNKPEIYKFNEAGEVIEHREINAENVDWEAMTQDENYIYVGDIGNNNGKRKSFTVYRIEKNNWNKIDRLQFVYSDYSPGTYTALAHDFDAEAMVVTSSQILLFSKSWRTKQVKVYATPKDKITEKLVLSPVATIDGLPGVVTGADWDAKKKPVCISWL